MDITAKFDKLLRSCGQSWFSISVGKYEWKSVYVVFGERREFEGRAGCEGFESGITRFVDILCASFIIVKCYLKFKHPI